MSEFDELICRAKAGELAAIEEMVQKYEKDVRIVARMNLGPAMRPHLDSVDLLQSVHRSILVGLKNEKFDISTPQKLINLATTIVRRKIARSWRKIKRQQRNGQLTAGEFSDVLVAMSSPDDQQAESNVKDVLVKLFERLDDEEKQLITLRIEGYSTADAARKLNQDPDVLRVKLSRMRKRIKSMGVFSDWI